MRLLSKTSPIPTILCVPLALAAAAALKAVLLAPVGKVQLAFTLSQQKLEDLALALLEQPPLQAMFLAGGPADALVWTLLVCGAFWAIASIVGMLFRRRWSLAMVRGGYLGVFLVAGVAALATYHASTVVGAAYKVASPDADDSAYNAFLFGWTFLRWALATALAAAGMLVLSWRGETVALFAPERAQLPGAAPGDQIIEDLRTGGRDRHYRKSWQSSAFFHWFLVIAVPFLLLLRGCVDQYKVPFGSGKARVTRVMRVQKRKKKPRKKYILRKNAAVYWDIPDLNESKIAEEVNKDTQLTHVADRNAVHGNMGAGGGDQGGWPDGVPGGKIRLIRLQYTGRDWDDGMDAHSGADINFLAFLRQEVPFPVARKSESHRVGLLKRYHKGFAPPFVYMTGSDKIHVSSTDRRILREYLLDGGMLFADAGSANWDHHFRAFIRTVFPGKRLIDIADDDEIFQMPYVFANGAPPLWHHGGNRALGIKHKGRWLVFYHPGDVNDAWKTGRSGMDPEIADKAFQMGINILYYSITKYLQLTKKYRKKV